MIERSEGVQTDSSEMCTAPQNYQVKYAHQARPWGTPHAGLAVSIGSPNLGMTSLAAPLETYSEMHALGGGSIRGLCSLNL